MSSAHRASHARRGAGEGGGEFLQHRNDGEIAAPDEFLVGEVAHSAAGIFQRGDEAGGIGAVEAQDGAPRGVGREDAIDAAEVRTGAQVAEGFWATRRESTRGAR